MPEHGAVKNVVELDWWDAQQLRSEPRGIRKRKRGS
jgi:hypothetical protein